ncbi:MAG TPA: hypothetical protein VGD14_09895, partial [bacterium]
DPDKPNGYKFEMFIFDALQDAERAVIMEIDRAEEFSPIKNKTGIDSAETARIDLVNYYRRLLEQAGIIFSPDFSPEKSLIEISPSLALNTKELRKKINIEKFEAKFPMLLE